jgi:hypothetical protein
MKAIGHVQTHRARHYDWAGGSTVVINIADEVAKAATGHIEMNALVWG